MARDADAAKRWSATQFYGACMALAISVPTPSYASRALPQYSDRPQRMPRRGQSKTPKQRTQPDASGTIQVYSPRYQGFNGSPRQWEERRRASDVEQAQMARCALMSSGGAKRGDTRRVPAGVADHDDTPEAPRLVRDLHVSSRLAEFTSVKALTGEIVGATRWRQQIDP